MITTQCATHYCHSLENAPLTGILVISNYQETIKDSSDIKQAVLSGFMPRGEPLTDCEIKILVTWIKEGGKNI